VACRSHLDSGPEHLGPACRKSHHSIRGRAELAENKIQCECGNSNWVNFLYVSASREQVIAGCKRCGRTYGYEAGTWKPKGGPAPEHIGGRQ
jgi:transcription elongation factor Elf1